MYIPSIDPATLREDEVVSLNPITLPQRAVDIPFEVALAFGQPPDVIATYTGIVQTADTVTAEHVLLSSEMQAGTDVSAVAPGNIGLAAEITGSADLDLNTDLLKTVDPGLGSLSGLSDFSALSDVTAQRYFLVNADGPLGVERRLLLTVALPHPKSIAPDARVRLYARPCTAPLFVSDPLLTADLTVSPTVHLTAESAMPDVRMPWDGPTTTTTTAPTTTEAPQVALDATIAKESLLYAALYDGEIVGGISIHSVNPDDSTESDSSAPMDRIHGRSDLIARLTGGEPGPLIDDEIEKFLQSTLSAETDLTASDAHRRISLRRCTHAVDLSSPVRGHYQYVIDHTAPVISTYVPRRGGFVSFDLTPLLTDTEMVYTFVVSTEDADGFLITNYAPGAQWRRPCVVYFDEWRSGSQALTSSYFAAIVTVTLSNGASYPVPYFSVSEARRLATDWNKIAADNDDPERQYLLEYNDITGQFDKIMIDDDEINTVVDSIDPIRIGTTLYYPLLTYDINWALDRSTELDRIREIIFATSSVAAQGDAIPAQPLRATYGITSESELTADLGERVKVSTLDNTSAESDLTADLTNA